MSKKKYTLDEAIDFVTGGDISELSDLSDDSDCNEIEAYTNDVSSSSESDTDDDEEYNVPLAKLSSKEREVGTNEDNNVGTTSKAIHTLPMAEEGYYGERLYLHQFVFWTAVEDKTALQYFYQFFTPDLIALVANQTNLYSFQKKHQNIKTTTAEITSLIGIMMKMGIVKLPQYRLYWSQQLRYPPVADVMSCNRFQQLMENLHFINNDDIDKNDKLAKITPIINAVRDECIKVEPEEHHSVDEQIIPSKTKFSSIHEYNPKKPKKWGFNNLVRTGSSGFMYDFYIYQGKSGKESSDEENDYQHLQKSAQVVLLLLLLLLIYLTSVVICSNARVAC